MGFFYAGNKDVAKKSAPKAGSRGVIPIASLREMGCKVCPHDKAELRTPKMRPSGSKSAPIYLLGTSPTEEDDREDSHWMDKGGAAVYAAFGNAFMKNQVRSNYITQCRGDQTEVHIECCRRRIEADIEETKPQVIVTVGDAPLRWVVGDTEKGISALNMRGTKMVAKIGAHTCYVVPIIWPKYAFSNRRARSEHALAMEFDVAAIKALVSVRDMPKPKVYTGNYFEGIELVTDFKRLEKRLADMATYRKSAIDIETNGFRPYRLKDPMILTAAVGTFEDSIAFPVHHPGGWDTPRRQKMVLDMLGEYLLFSGRKAAHHLGMEMEWLEYFFGPEVLYKTEWDDTMAMAHTLDERKGTKSLEVQTLIHFGFNLKAQSKVDPARLLEFPLPDVLQYNGGDTKWTDKLRDTLMPRIRERDADLADYERKVRLAPTLITVGAKGLPYSLDVAKGMVKQFDATVKELERKIQNTPEVRKYTQRFGTFSPSSDAHVMVLMEKVLDRPEVVIENWDGTTKKTTGEEALSAMPADEVPSAQLILDHRGASKLVSTYIEPVLSGKIIDRDGRIRAKYGSMVAETGRLNSDDPNIQNWPKRKFKEIRRIVTASGWVMRFIYHDGTHVDVPQDRCFLACDYGQIEFRVVGMASEDEEIVRACWTGYDVHKFWAERLVKLYPKVKDRIVAEFNIDWDKAGIKTLRQDIKNMWVFPQFFGSSVQSCADNLKLPSEIADDLAEEFWDTFRKTKAWQDKLLQKYEKNLYVETLGGRRRRGALSKYQIVNHPIQGTAADIVLEAMVALTERGVRDGMADIIPNLNVHDDLTFLPTVDNLDACLDIIKVEMCKPRFDYINVPLMVEASVGMNWCDLEEVGKYRSDELFGHTNPYLEAA